MLTFSEWCAKPENGYDESRLTDQQRRHLEAAWKADSEPASPISRIGNEVSRLTSKWRSNPEKCAQLEAVGERALAEGWSVQKCQYELLKVDRAIGPMILTPRSGGGQGSVLEASVLMSAGVSQDQAGQFYDQNTMDAALSAQYRGAGLQSIFKAALASAGRHVPTRIADQHIREVFELSAEGPSTISVSGILSAVVNKSLLASFAAVPMTFGKFSRSQPLNDFKPSKAFRLTGGGLLEKVAPGGEIKHATMSDSTYSLQADTYGKMISIDRRDIINDDLGALSTSPKILGRLAAITLERSVYELLLSNPSNFFHADNKNLSTGSGSVLSLAGLDAAFQLFASQVDSAGNPIMITPEILLLPPALQITGQNLVRAQTLVGTTGTPIPSSNSFAGMFSPVTSPFLGEAAGLTNADDEAWYLVAGAGDFSVVTVGFVGGHSEPFVEQGMMDFDRLGWQCRVFWDYGISMHEPKGGVLSNGNS